jgi:hypothetical protein
MEVYQWVDGQCGDLVGPFEGSEMEAVKFCYDNWPEMQAYEQAVAEWRQKPEPKNWDDYPERPKGPPPYGILRPDGSWFPWDTEDDAEDEVEEGTSVILDESVSCQRCQSHRVANAGGKCSDMGYFQMGSIDHDGYLPSDVGIGGGDYVEIRYCLDCGQMQGSWPVAESDIEKGEDDSI